VAGVRARGACVEGAVGESLRNRVRSRVLRGVLARTSRQVGVLAGEQSLAQSVLLLPFRFPSALPRAPSDRRYSGCEQQQAGGFGDGFGNDVS